MSIRTTAVLAIFTTIIPTCSAQFVQQGGKLVGVGTQSSGTSEGTAVALSADGNTAIVGGSGDNSLNGAVWIFTRANGIWSTQGIKLVANEATIEFGAAVAMSADGTTALVGQAGGAAWVFTQSNGVWSQSAKLTSGTPDYNIGSTVALSGDGNTAAVGATDSQTIGGVWIFVRVNGAWTQQGGVLAGAGYQGTSGQGSSLALSTDGNTLIEGGPGDAGNGAAWVFTRSAGAWSQQGNKLTVASTAARFGYSVSLSADGNTALIGGPYDANLTGAAWIFVRINGVWSQKGTKLTGMPGGDFGYSVSLSANGKTALVGAPQAPAGEPRTAWVLQQSGSTWTETTVAPTGNAPPYRFGWAVSLSGDGNTALVGGPDDSNNEGAAWVFAQRLATHFSVSAPPAVTLGAAFNFTVTALGADGNPVTGYPGTVQFGSSDSAAVLPVNAALTNGIATFSATLKTAGPQTITATDTASSPLTGTSSGIAVSTIVATQFAVSAPASTSSGVTFPFTVTALDSGNHIAIGYTGAVHFNSSDGAAFLTGDATLVNGTGTFTTALATAGAQTITATDTVNHSITGTSNAIAVDSTAAVRFVQQGSKLLPSDAVGSADFGFAIAIAGDGNTAVVGGVSDSSGIGAAWIFTRTNGIWTQQGNKLVPNDAAGKPGLGSSVAISADGNTITITGRGDNSNQGAVWLFTRANGVWTQQGSKLAGVINHAMSGDAGTLMIVNASNAVTIFTRGNSAWNQQASLSPNDAAGNWVPGALSLSADGNTALIGAPGDNSAAGAAWVFVRTSGSWSQQGPKLVGTSAQASAQQGSSVSLSADGSTAIVGGPGSGGPSNPNPDNGGAWVFTRSGGTWLQQSGKLTGTGTLLPSNTTGGISEGWSVAISRNGSRTFMGAPADNLSAGASWAFSRSNGAWTQLGSKLVGTSGAPSNVYPLGQGAAVALSADGSTALAGDASDQLGTGAVWVFAAQAVPTQLMVSTPASAAVGQAFNATVTALDANNNVAANYSGTIQFTSSDPAAVLPPNSKFVNGTGVFSVTLNTATAQILTVTDTLQPAVTATSNTIAVYTPPTTLWVIPNGSQSNATASAGVPITVTVNALTKYYTGTVHFTSTDPSALLPPDTALANGQAVFQITLKTLGPQTITATDTANHSLTGTSPSITVTAPVATQLSVSAPLTVTRGVPFNFTVTALDVANNTVTGYTGKVHFTSSDSTATLPADATLTNGVGTFSATLNSIYGGTIVATDAVTASITGTSGTIDTFSTAATLFNVSAPSTAIVGVPFTFTITAVNPLNRTDTNYAGTVRFGSTDRSAVLPANSTLTNGAGTFTITLNTPGQRYISVNDASNGNIAGSSSAVTVAAGAVTHFAVSAPSTTTAGGAITFTVTALDVGNNTITGYSGTVHFTSTDPSATLPANTTLTNGAGSFSATLKTAGSQTVSAIDTVTSTITGTSGSIAVGSGPAAALILVAPASATAGAAFNFTVTALDAYNNTATGYSKTVRFSSTDPSATLPANTTLMNGAGSFSATLKTAGSQTITATDTSISSNTGISNAVAVAAGPTILFSVVAPASATPGSPFNFTVTALDSYSNTVTGYARTVRFTSTDAAAVLPASATLTAGTGTFSATLKTSGAQSITAIDSSFPNITGVSAAIAVSGATPPSPFLVNPAVFSGASQPIAFTFTDPRGFQDLSVVDILINNFLDGRHACYLAYSVPSNTLYLVDDAGDAGGPFAGGMVLSGPGSIHNSQCTVTAGSTPVSAGGNVLTLSLNIALGAGGNQIIYMAARDAAGNNSGWQALGTWGVPFTPAGNISVSGLAPGNTAAHAGTAQVLTATLTDNKGTSDFGVINFLINNFIDGRQACYLAYVASTNSLLLVDDAGDAGGPFAGSMVLNGSGTIQNSQCSVTAAGSSVTTSGNKLTIAVNVTFKSGFTGNRIVWVAARDGSGGNNTDWQALGTQIVE
jgi:hypothetical protein